MYKFPKDPVESSGTIVVRKGGDTTDEQEQRPVSSWEDIKARREPKRDAATEERYRRHRRKLISGQRVAVF